MKRFSLFIITALLLAVTAISYAPLQASAASPRAVEGTSDQEAAQACKTRWDGRELSGDGLKRFQASDCSARNGGTCQQRVGANDQAKVTCSTNVGEEGSTNDAAAGALNESNSDPALTVCDRNNCNLVRNFINPFIVVLTYIVGLAVAIGIIIGGIQVSTSAGDPQKSASGKKHIQNALIGLVSYVVLYAFLNFILPGGINQ